MGYYITFDGGSGTGKGTIIAWCGRYLLGRGKDVVIFKDKEYDPFAVFGAAIIRWCKKKGIDHQTFLLPLFAAGRAAMEGNVARLLDEHEIVLRDRSFISSLGYQAGSGIFNQEEICELYVDYLGLRVPDLAVIVDTPVRMAMERISQREHHERGMGGMISGDLENRKCIRNRFLELPEQFGNQMNIIVVRNNGGYTDNPSLLERRIARASTSIISVLQERGVL